MPPAKSEHNTQMELDGARIVFTGASAGIGATLPLAVAERGAALGLLTRRTGLLQ